LLRKQRKTLEVHFFCRTRYIDRDALTDKGF